MAPDLWPIGVSVFLRSKSHNRRFGDDIFTTFNFHFRIVFCSINFVLFKTGILCRSLFFNRSPSRLPLQLPLLLLWQHALWHTLGPHDSRSTGITKTLICGSLRAYLGCSIEIYWLKSKYLFIAILCVKMSRVNMALIGVNVFTCFDLANVSLFSNRPNANDLKPKVCLQSFF